MKFIRWQGLVAFTAFVGLIVLIVITMLDSWIKWGVEHALSEATGAEVNVASAGHRFSPFGVNLSGVQITDPAKPSHNQLQAENIDATIELYPLLMQKLIIDELTLSGVKFDQLRQQPGEVYRQAQDGSSADAASPSVKLPTVDELLARSPLKTTKAIEEARTGYASHKQTLETQYQSLPDKQKLEEYKARLKTIREIKVKDAESLAKAKQAFDELKGELKQDKQTLSAFKTAVGDAKNDMGTRLTNLKNAPQQDYDQLKAVYAGDQAAIEDLTRAVLGDKAASWSNNILSAYTLVAPMLKQQKQAQQERVRAEGDWVLFDDDGTQPDFLIRKASISIDWQQESIRSDWQDITYQHERIGRPTLFSIDNQQGRLWQSLNVNGEFRFLKDGLDAIQNWDLKGIKLDNLKLADNDKLTSVLQQARLNSSGQVKAKGQSIDGQAKVALREMTMQATGTNKLTNALASAVSGMNALDIQAIISGDLQAPDIRFKSDLDRQLGGALLSNLTAEQQGKLDSLKSSLNERIAGPLANQNNNLNQLLEWDKLADGNLTQIEDLLKSEFNNALDQQKDKLKDKLKNKLLGN